MARDQRRLAAIVSAEYRDSSRSHPASSTYRDWNRSLAGVADALLVFFPTLTLAKKLSLPQIASFGELVSATTRSGFEPLTNYVQFALSAIVVWTAFFLGYRRGKPIIAWILQLPENSIRMSRGGRAFMWVVAATALAIYFINVTSVTLDGPLTDGFHEGEYLGFIPVIAAGKAVLASTFLVHGPGVDLLPGFVATKFGNPENGIVATRLAYAALRTVAVVASFLAVVTFTRLLSPRSSRAKWLVSSALALMFFVMALQIGAWHDVPTFHKTMNARDAGFLLQVLAVLVFAQIQRGARSSMAALAIAAIIGGSLLWAVFYSYDRGLYGAAFLLLASTAFGVCGGTWARTWFVGLSLGAVIGSALLYAVFGSQGIGAVVEQVAFWVHYGRAVWAYAGIVALPDTLAGVLLAGSFIALALGTARVLRAIAAAGTLREAFRGEIGVIVLSVASIWCLRTAIERGDVGHVASGVTASWIMLSVFFAKFAMDTFQSMPRFDPAGATGNTNSGVSVVMVAVSAVVGWNLAFLDPYTAYDRLNNQYFGAVQTNDKKILSPRQVSTLNAIRDDLRSSSCFYTLTNEGAWYYLLHKQSCSRFYQVTNARPVSAQREVVAALEATSPAVILFSSGGWSSAAVDGVSPFNANPEVMRYVLLHYIPDKLAADNWFWRRSDGPRRFSDRTVGTTVDAASEGTQAWDLQMSGTYGNDLMTSPPKALFVTEGDENAPIWAGRADLDEHLLNRWSVPVPTAALTPGHHRIRVWAFREMGVPMLQLGNDVELQIR